MEEVYQIEESLRTLSDSISDPHLSETIDQIIDAFENKKTAFADLAYRDEETGLFNNVYFMGRIREEISRAVRYNRALSLLIIELGDCFGDSFSEAAGAIAEALRRSDTYARISRSEFAALLPETDSSQSKRVAEKILNSIQPFSIETCLDAWIGISELDPEKNSAPELEKTAYRARDAAKEHQTPVFVL